jgi:hypothetical protein
MRNVGQVANLRPIVNRPETPAKSSARPIDNRPQVNNLPHMGPL